MDAIGSGSDVSAELVCNVDDSRAAVDATEEVTSTTTEEDSGYHCDSTAGCSEDKLAKLDGVSTIADDCSVVGAKVSADVTGTLEDEVVSTERVTVGVDPQSDEVGSKPVEVAGEEEGEIEDSGESPTLESKIDFIAST